MITIEVVVQNMGFQLVVAWLQVRSLAGVGVGDLGPPGTALHNPISSYAATGMRTHRE